MVEWLITPVRGPDGCIAYWVSTQRDVTTNALRHGSLADPNGRLQVTWWIEEGQPGRVLRWEWAEHDGPPVGYPTREGFGHRLLNKVLASQTGATVDVAFAPDGLRVSVRMPLPSVSP